MLENMPTDATEKRPESARVRRRKLRLRTIAELDGRTTAARRAGALVATFEAALGGQLTGAQRLAMHNAAALTAIAEDSEDRGESVMAKLHWICLQSGCSARIWELPGWGGE